MRNRAKCKLCGDILESFHQYDFVTCKCGEISIDGGNYNLSAAAKDWKNFLRVDDLGNEIIVKVKDPNALEAKEDPVQEPSPLSREDQINMLQAMVNNIENLPKNALDLPVNHYDLYSFMMLITAIFKSEK
jgi:hypothetical protein